MLDPYRTESGPAGRQRTIVELIRRATYTSLQLADLRQCRITVGDLILILDKVRHTRVNALLIIRPRVDDGDKEDHQS